MRRRHVPQVSLVPLERLHRLARGVGSVALGASFLAGMAGCGRTATEADCRLIVDKSVELQMKQMAKAEPDAIEKRQTQLRQDLEGEMKDCVGRRISESMMTCVKNASSSDALEKCVR